MRKHRRPFLSVMLPAVLLAACSTTAALGQPSATAGVDAVLDAALKTAEALQEPYNRARSVIAVAEAYGTTGSKRKAEAAIDTAVAVSRDSVKARLLLLEAGEACVRAGLYAKAWAVAEQLRHPGNAVHLLCKAAQAQIIAGIPSAGIQTLEAAGTKAASMTDAEAAGRAWAKIAEVCGEAGLTEQFDAALAQAAQSAGRIGDRFARAMLRERMVELELAAGLFSQALSTARSIEVAEGRIPALVVVAGALGEAGRTDEALGALREAQQAAAEVAEPTERAFVLVRIAEACGPIGATDLAAAILAQAEQVLTGAEEPYRAAAVRDRLAEAYLILGDREAAERVVRGCKDATHRSAKLVRLALLAADRKRYEAALRLIQQADAKAITYSGMEKLKGLGEAYYQAWGAEVDLRKIARLQPSELRDMVLARYTKAYAAAKQYERAIRYAQSIAFPVTRDDALGVVATKCLEAADSMEQAGPALEVLKVLEGRLDRLRLRSQLAVKQTDLGLADQALVALRKLTKDLQEEKVQDARAELLCQAAVTLYRLEKPAEAKQAAAQAIAAALKIGCASCRDDVLKEMFACLSGRESVELAIAAGAEMRLAKLRAENFIRMVQLAPDLTAAQKEKLLREALEASVEVATLSERIELLVLTARHYHELGLAVSADEQQLLRESLTALAAREAREAAQPPATVRAEEPHGIRLVYFDRAGCPYCAEVKKQFKELRSMIPRVEIQTLDLDADESAAPLNIAICTGLDIAEEEHLIAPSVFSARRGLVGTDITLASLAELARGAEGLESAAVVFGHGRERARSELAETYEDLGVLVVVSAGLFDGLNPCAFTVIIFFLSYLAYIGKEKREIAAVGIVFTAAVFITYFAVGLALVGLLGAAREWSGTVTRVLYGVTAALALVAAVLSFRDGVRCLKGRTADLTLSLPDSLKSKIRLTISKRARLGLTVGATAVLGAAVALFELPCTGQVYVPIAFALHHLPEYLWGPVGWLLLYNLCFIAPLVLVFLGVFFGLTSERLTAVFRRHIAKTKFAMAAVFAALAAFMLVYLL